MVLKNALIQNINNLVFNSHINYEGDVFFFSKTSTVDLKREVVNRLFANLELDGEKLRYTLRVLFDKILNLANPHEWQAMIDDLRTDSDMRMLIITSAISASSQNLNIICLV